MPASLSPLVRRLGGRLLVAAVGACAGVAAAAPAASLAPACEGPDTTVLSPVQAALVDRDGPAQAAWIDDRRLRWPGVQPKGDERVRLHHSDAGRLALAPDGSMSGADGQHAMIAAAEPLDDDTAKAVAYLGSGADLRLTGDWPLARRQALLRGQLLLTLEDRSGRVLRATAVQPARALDRLFESAEGEPDLGASVRSHGVELKLWAPTARRVGVCVYPGPEAPARLFRPMQRHERSGVWHAELPGTRAGAYYRYLVEVFVPGTGWVRNLVTDPYSLSLSADSRRSYIADLSDPALEPPGWRSHAAPAAPAAATDMVIYELHVRDFSRDDVTVPEAARGKYVAFQQPGSAGMRHLRALAGAGLTDVHLLPVFDLATVPERACVTPPVAPAAPDSEQQQAIVLRAAAQDCFNWGYDPFHYNAPEGSFATDANDGAVRIRELRGLVMGLHLAGLLVGMDVVYNHTAASGQQRPSVLDRIVPFYYHRLDARGRVERSTCCDNTATEHRMMGRLLIDSVVLWARAYGMASFRFDLMGHQPRALMERLQARLRQVTGHEVPLIGEGWNFGEVANGARFVQASQRSLGGTGIGTFSDRGRDAVRGGAAGDDAATSMARPGFVVPALAGDGARQNEWGRQADLVRLALAGTLRSYHFQNLDGVERSGKDMRYGDQPAGYASQPAEVVNYVENHDNQTLFDALVLKLPRATTPEDRARTQILALGLNALSQGVAYFHAGGELLRSKSMDRNSYDSGDWFNFLDWQGQDNGFARGLPPRPDNGADYALLRPLLADRMLKPSRAVIDWTRRAFLDLLRIRASTPLWRLRTAQEVQQRLSFLNTGPGQQPGLIVGRLDGQGLPGTPFSRLLFMVNASETSASMTLASEASLAWRLHPVQRSPDAADRRVAEQASVTPQGRFSVPGRSIAVFVVEASPGD